MASQVPDEFQTQMLEMLRAQQDAYLSAVRAWREAVAAAEAGGAPPPPSPQPSPQSAMPTPAEMTEAYYSFASKLLAEQSRFMEALSQAMAVPPRKG